ncbi:cryptococcal mannosyltransferase 1-domain-containing protein [Apiospora phragmitis]|uniref:Cryptococcal mannosyltransferase 1-domain-containing protein n=1 Tax=Apiospora phragmitis TaxID=2905665 RepID=A0ABR1TWE7_9PEZI
MKVRRIFIIQVLCALILFSIIHVSLRGSSPESWSRLKPYVPVPWKNGGDKHVEIAWPYEPQLDNITAPYVKSILNSNDTSLPRLQCPPFNSSRYAYLKTATGKKDGQDVRYFFALDLRQSEHLLARLLGSIVEAAHFLGMSSCALSIVEGNSDDATPRILAALQPELRRVGLRYFLNLTDINPKVDERIGKLAQLRNLALDPLSSAAVAADASTTIIFVNDVAPCPDDLLELVHQRRLQSADMTCAMDWTYAGKDPTFYDVWVARTLKGDSFFQIPPDGSWDQAWNLFAGDPDTQQRYNQKLPFQVFACWNGATAFGAGPVLGLPAEPGRGAGGEAHGGKVAFRSNREEECYAGEPTLFCKDLWWAGYGRIAVIPSVNIEYSDEASTKIKKLKGFTSKWTAQEDLPATRIEWQREPPAQWKCMHGWHDQVWVPWNQTLN